MIDYDKIIECRYAGAIYDKYACIKTEDKGNNKANIELLNY